MHVGPGRRGPRRVRGFVSKMYAPERVADRTFRSAEFPNPLIALRLFTSDANAWPLRDWRDPRRAAKSSAIHRLAD